MLARWPPKARPVLVAVGMIPLIATGASGVAWAESSKPAGTVTAVAGHPPASVGIGRMRPEDKRWIRA